MYSIWEFLFWIQDIFLASRCSWTKTHKKSKRNDKIVYIFVLRVIHALKTQTPKQNSKKSRYQKKIQQFSTLILSDRHTNVVKPVSLKIFLSVRPSVRPAVCLCVVKTVQHVKWIVFPLLGSLTVLWGLFVGWSLTNWEFLILLLFLAWVNLELK